MVETDTATEALGTRILNIRTVLPPIAMLLCLSFIRWQSGVLLFHTLAELFSIVVGILMLVIVWNTRHFTKNDFLLYLGIGYFWIAILDTWHTFTLKGMPFFAIDDVEITLHFWIYTRYIEAVLLLTAPLFLKKKLNSTMMLYGMAPLVAIVSWASFSLEKPVMLTSEGLTTFKVVSEYIISLLLITSIFIYYRHRALLTNKVLVYTVTSMVLTICAELSFTLYTSINGLGFVIGHLMKFLSFWCIYQAIVQTTLREPFTILAQRSSSYDAIPHPAVVVDRNAIIYQVNKAAVLECGKDATQLIHTPVHQHFHESNILESDCKLCMAIKKGHQIDNMEIYRQYSDKWYLISLAPISSTGVNGGMVQSTTDVTRQVVASRALEKSIEELKDKEQQNEMMHKRVLHQQEAIIKISEINTLDLETSEIFAEVTKLISDGIDVERIGIWFYDPTFSQLQCIDLLTNTIGEHIRGQVIEMGNCPHYKAALESDSYIAINHAKTDTRTSEFTESYLIPHDISSMLDSAIRMKGKVLGVVCLEHVGDPREWTLDECLFVERVADQVSSILSEVELEESRLRLQNTQAVAHLGSWEIDNKLGQLYWSDETYKIFGIKKEDFIITYEGYINLVHPDDRKMLDGAFKKSIKDKLPIFEIQHRITNQKTNKIRTVYVKCTHSRNKKGDLVRSVGMIHDITERVKIEDIMIQTEKMQSVAGLAAGMAHEINNPLSIITQGIQNSLRRLDPNNSTNREIAKKAGIDGVKMYDFLEERKIITFLTAGKNAVDRAADIVKNMLLFSRKSGSTIVTTDLSELLEHTINLGASDYDMQKKYDFKFVDIKKEYDPDLPCVNCCPNEIEQVLLNLFKNALQAMEEIEAEEYTPQFHVRLIKEPDFARIEIEDNGPGIPEDVKNQIFEPFFTTKPAGVGTGLGLSVSSMIITQNHNGTFEVESEHGKGTKFIIRLPIV